MGMLPLGGHPPSTPNTSGALPSGADPPLTDGYLAYAFFCLFGILFFVQGLAAFCSGLTSPRAALSQLAYSIIVCSLVMIQYYVVGYSLENSSDPLRDGSWGRFIGDLHQAFLRNVDYMSVSDMGRILLLYGFSVVPACLLASAACQRGRLVPLLVFVTVWMTLVYCPVAHWCWHPNGWSYQLGVLDYAGGTIIHITAGFGALVYSLVLGPRLAYLAGREDPPFSLPMVVSGTAHMLIGWIGFTGASQTSDPVGALLGVFNTLLSAATGGFTWMLLDYAVARWSRPPGREGSPVPGGGPVPGSSASAGASSSLGQAGSARSSVAPQSPGAPPPVRVGATGASTFSYGSTFSAPSYSAPTYAASNGASTYVAPYEDVTLSLVSFCSGVISGLVAITPGAGYVPSWAAMLFGLSGAIGCNLGTKIKFFLGIDDPLDVFAVHGIGGLIGTLLTGVFALPEFKQPWQFWRQLVSGGATAAYTLGCTLVIVVAIDSVPALALRLEPTLENTGIDTVEHGESASPGPATTGGRPFVGSLGGHSLDVARLRQTNVNTSMQLGPHDQPLLQNLPLSYGTYSRRQTDY